MDTRLFGNGIDGRTGGYLTREATPRELADVALAQPADPAMAEIAQRQTHAEAHFGLQRGLNPNDLSDSGWGVIFSHDADPAMREALSPLLELRHEQASARQDRYREFAGAKGFTPMLEKDQFLSANNAAPGRVNPDKVPYYLLIVGDPATIPYEFQYLLDVAYAVGRICFDSPDEYACYARSVVEAERGARTRPRQAAFFGVRNPDDDATALSAEYLVAPLAEKLAERAGADWIFSTAMGEDARKVRLATLMGGEATPALLFTASHGVGFPCGDPLQARHQGALLCGDWPGPVQHAGPLSPDHYFSRDDLETADVAGLISFHFACYGAGTPQYDEFSRRPDMPPKLIAPAPMLAPLAKRLLAHEKGGALAFVGHVERAWAYSFVWPGAEAAQRESFEDALGALLDGCTVGFAMEAFNERYAELATMLASEIGKIRVGRKRDDLRLAQMWTAHNDARNYAIVGDPAVRLAVASQ